MKNSIQIIDNRGMTVKSFLFDDTYESWWSARENANKTVKKLVKKYKDFFGTVRCKSRKLFLGKSKQKYSVK